MHASKLYGPRTGRQNSYGTARGPYGPREWTYDFCSKQTGSSRNGAQEHDATGAWPVNFPNKGQSRGALMFSSVCAWTLGWGNNGDAGELARYRAHYYVIVMFPYHWPLVPHTKSLQYYFLVVSLTQTVQQSIELPMIWEAVTTNTGVQSYFLF